MMLNVNMCCDVARCADAAAAALRADGVTVTTAGTWKAPMVVGSPRAIQARITDMLLAVVEEIRAAAGGTWDAAVGEAEADAVVSVAASAATGAADVLLVRVACGPAAREMTLPMLGAVAV